MRTAFVLSVTLAGSWFAVGCDSAPERRALDAAVDGGVLTDADVNDAERPDAQAPTWQQTCDALCEDAFRAGRCAGGYADPGIDGVYGLGSSAECTAFCADPKGEGDGCGQARACGFVACPVEYLDALACVVAEATNCEVDFASQCVVEQAQIDSCDP